MHSSVHKNYDQLFSLDSIFEAWKKFRRGKSGKADVMNFELHLEDNLFGLHEDLQKGRYRHSGYAHFQVFDSKKRDIHKAQVRDRVVHQIIYDYLVELYDPKFIADSYASRKNKGQHKAVDALRHFIKLVGGKRGECFVLKCDVRKYFNSIDQKILLDLIKEKIFCEKTLAIVEGIITSYFFSNHPGKGVPLGNITSQIFANIYLDVLDRHIKKDLKCRFYVRYNDDFVVVAERKDRLENIRSKVIVFVGEKLLLEITLEKTSFRKTRWGVDFLGFIILPKAMLVRNKTKAKIKNNICRKNIDSYLGILDHCNAYNLKEKILAMEKLRKIW